MISQSDATNASAWSGVSLMAVSSVLLSCALGVLGVLGVLLHTFCPFCPHPHRIVSRSTHRTLPVKMPHSIRDYFLNTNLTSGNYSSSSYSSSNASASGPSRGYTSSFNTTYSINPSTLPSYTYTNRFLQQQRAATAAAPASSGSARMTQYPPPQHQYYHSTPSGGPNNSAGPGYSSTYTGGGNSDRYNSSYSGGYQMSSTGSGSSGGTHSKTVCRMDCRYCSAVVCLRGMKAMLLADTSVELYSTDHPPGS